MQYLQVVVVRQVWQLGSVVVQDWEDVFGRLSRRRMRRMMDRNIEMGKDICRFYLNFYKFIGLE
jgi:hypothetical protein